MVFMRLKKVKKTTFLPKSLRKGQIVVEYVLLLMVGVAVAVLITSLMVSRSTSDPGFLIKQWKRIIDFIAEDYPDEI